MGKEVWEAKAAFSQLATGVKKMPPQREPQAVGSIFLFTNSVFWVPGIFDPQPAKDTKETKERNPRKELNYWHLV